MLSPRGLRRHCTRSCEKRLTAGLSTKRCVMDLTFGTRLRLQRERQCVALTAIAEETKISVSLLDALERDDVSRWPGGVFRRAYVRAYAQAIGLQPEAVLREFVELYQEPVEETSAVLALAQSAPGGPPTRIRFLLKSAVAALSRLGIHREGVTASSTAPVPAAVLPVAAPLSLHREDRDLSQETGCHPARPRNALSANHHTSDQQETPSLDRELLSFARLCTALGCAHEHTEMTSAMGDAARVLEARGITLWLWNSRQGRLCAVLVHGYSDELVARWSPVARNTNNAIAAAFRSGQVRVVKGTGGPTGAFVAPVMTPTGCAGVLAMEFENGGEQRESVQALATILSAQLSTLVVGAPVSRAVSA